MATDKAVSFELWAVSQGRNPGTEREMDDRGFLGIRAGRAVGVGEEPRMTRMGATGGTANRSARKVLAAAPTQ